MSDNIENIILTQLREMREENQRFREATRKELAELKNLVGGQGVLLTSIAGYIHQVEERVEALEGRDE
jgi:flagellar motility protein MotE (MotC chaperone)